MIGIRYKLSTAQVEEKKDQYEDYHVVLVSPTTLHSRLVTLYY